jgi:hypothetical protein
MTTYICGHCGIHVLPPGDDAGTDRKCDACKAKDDDMKEETLADSPDLPDSFWIVDFMKFTKEGRPIEGTSWRWAGIVFNARQALEASVEAMIDEKPEEAGYWRCVRIAMDRQAVLAQKTETKTP